MEFSIDLIQKFDVSETAEFSVRQSLMGHHRQSYDVFGVMRS
jgi:hypothetical protein